jgi:lipopolysaccharide transport system permease protein
MSLRHASGGAVGAVALSWRLFHRTVGARYRRSFVGYFWMLAPPVLVGGIASLAARAGALNAGATGLPHFLFAIIGVVIWMTFAEAFEAPYHSIEEARPYLTRVNFPREAVVLARLYENIVAASVRLALILALLTLFGLLSFASAGAAAASVATAGLLGAGLGAMLAPFMVLFSDLRDTLKLGIAYGIFISPALYEPRGGLFGAVINANPLAPVMNFARDAAAGVAFESGTAFAIVLGLSLLLGWAGIAIYKTSSVIIVERMLLGGR